MSKCLCCRYVWLCVKLEMIKRKSYWLYSVVAVILDSWYYEFIKSHFENFRETERQGAVVRHGFFSFQTWWSFHAPAFMYLLHERHEHSIIWFKGSEKKMNAWCSSTTCLYHFSHGQLIWCHNDVQSSSHQFICTRQFSFSYLHETFDIRHFNACIE